MVTYDHQMVTYDLVIRLTKAVKLIFELMTLSTKSQPISSPAEISLDHWWIPSSFPEYYTLHRLDFCRESLTNTLIFRTP